MVDEKTEIKKTEIKEVENEKLKQDNKWGVGLFVAFVVGALLTAGFYEFAKAPVVDVCLAPVNNNTCKDSLTLTWARLNGSLNVQLIEKNDYICYNDNYFFNASFMERFASEMSNIQAHRED